MTNFWSLTDDARRTVITQTANRANLPVQAVEKDLWMTTILQLVFTLPFAESLLFKGGSSLSKGWGLIERFSYHK
jgi:predicted nucleotidyltransferase component of viral defense system